MCLSSLLEAPVMLLLPPSNQNKAASGGGKHRRIILSAYVVDVFLPQLEVELNTQVEAHPGPTLHVSSSES